jgi:hypothetical protein
MSIRIKGPNADTIFEKFKRNVADKKKLQKLYGVKKASFNPDNVTAAEYVKGVLKEAVFYYSVDVSIKPEGKKEVERLNWKKAEKIKFYEFKKPIAKEDWKGGNTAPMAKSFKPIQCPICKGSGKKVCKSCNGSGVRKCPDCDGKGSRECKSCKGKGKDHFYITVIKEPGRDKDKKTIEIRCNSCFGSGKIACPTCNGLNKVMCKKCDGSSAEVCDNCGGTGNLYEYEILPVPFKEQNDTFSEFVPSVKTNMEKNMGQNITELLNNIDVSGITLKSEKDFNKKIIEPNLGYYNKNIDKALSKIEKDIKIYSKKDGHKINWPVYMFPLVVLDCETPKGKKYNVYSIGSDKNFKVFGKL